MSADLTNEQIQNQINKLDAKITTLVKERDLLKQVLSIRADVFGVGSTRQSLFPQSVVPDVSAARIMAQTEKRFTLKPAALQYLRQHANQVKTSEEILRGALDLGAVTKAHNKLVNLEWTLDQAIRDGEPDLRRPMPHHYVIELN